MKSRLIAAAVGVFVALGMVGVTGASATPSALRIKAVVVKQMPVAGGGVMVTLGAITVSSVRHTAIKHVMYKWDLTTDGVFETPLSTSSLTTQFYKYHANNTVTATVVAVGGTATRWAQASVTFQLIAPHRVGVPGLRIKAVVVKQVLMATGGVMVTLGAFTVSSGKRTAIKSLMYTWDLTTDGIFETPLSKSPLTSQVYLPTASRMVTATVVAMGGSAVRGATSSVTFQLLGR